MKLGFIIVFRVLLTSNSKLGIKEWYIKMVVGFEPTTSRTGAICHNRQVTNFLKQVILLKYKSLKKKLKLKRLLTDDCQLDIMAHFEFGADLALVEASVLSVKRSETKNLIWFFFVFVGHCSQSADELSFHSKPRSWNTRDHGSSPTNYKKFILRGY